MLASVDHPAFTAAEEKYLIFFPLADSVGDVGEFGEAMMSRTVPLNWQGIGEPYKISPFIVRLNSWSESFFDRSVQGKFFASHPRPVFARRLNKSRTFSQHGNTEIWPGNWRMGKAQPEFARVSCRISSSEIIRRQKFFDFKTRTTAKSSYARIPTPPKNE